MPKNRILGVGLLTPKYPLQLARAYSITSPNLISTRAASAPKTPNLTLVSILFRFVTIVVCETNQGHTPNHQSLQPPTNHSSSKTPAIINSPLFLANRANASSAAGSLICSNTSFTRAANCTPALHSRCASGSFKVLNFNTSMLLSSSATSSTDACT